MKKILVVIDMQCDFINGSLGTKEAEAIVERVIQKIKSYPPESIYATRDTHSMDYLSTMEGKYLPVPHCIKDTKGWAIPEEIEHAMPNAVIINKPTFGSLELVERMKEEAQKDEIELELIGLCTDICVVTNALLLKTALPEVSISVAASCCAGVTKESHEAALLTMKMCQIQVHD